MFALAVMAGGCSSGVGGSARLSGATAPVPPLAAVVTVPSRTMRAGSTMPARVIVFNRTGHAIAVSGCDPLFQVLLVSASYHPAVGWESCLRRFTIRVGESTYPATVAASYADCYHGQPEGGLKRCLPGGAMPSLPAGEYEAVLFEVTGIVPLPPAIAIHVTAPGPTP